MMALSPVSQSLVYKEVGGRVVIEAEHFDKRAKATDDDHEWKIVPDEDPGSPGYTNARGGKYMQVLPDGGQNRNNADLQTAGPALDFKFDVKTTGEYRLWLRITGFDGASDSVYGSILELRADAGGAGANWYRQAPDPDDSDFATKGDGIGWIGVGGADAVSGDAGGDPMTWTISKPGTYTLRIMQREDGLGIDAVCVQLNSLPDPTGEVPESPVEGTFILINVQPKDVTVNTGATATFSVDAAGSSAVKYQWQRAAAGSASFSNINGATSASLTTGALTTADNGAKYRVNVSIPEKSSTSREAILTVDTQGPTVAKISGSGTFTTATVVFNEAVTAATAGAKANYALDGGLTISDVKIVTPTMVRLTTSSQTSGTKYTVTVNNVKDLVGNTIAANAKATFTGFTLGRGGLTFEAYSGITGNSVQELLDNPKYPNSPDEFGFVAAFNSRLVYPNDSHEAYGGRISGWLIPAETAQYELFILSDDASQLFLSTDDKPANAVVIAEETGCCGMFEETGAPETSAPISLTAGKRYFIQALWKEGVGGDYCSVAMRKVGDTRASSTLQPITGDLLETYVSPDVSLELTQQPASATAAAGTAVTFSVRYKADSFLGSTAAVQWQKNGVDIAGATSQDLVIPFASSADNGAKYRAVVSVSTLASKTSADATLTVTVDTAPPKVTGVSGTSKAARVSFSEPLDLASAENRGNYGIDKGATVSSAKVVSKAGAASIVELSLGGATPGTVYSVKVSNAKDPSGNVIAPESGGSFVAYNAFYDFDDGQVPAGTQVFGPASVLPTRGVNGGGAMMLTPSVNSQQGGFLIPDLAGGTPVTRFTASFKMFVGEGSGNAADGYSFSFAGDVPEATVGEEGTGSGIIVAFDTYDNGGAEAPAVDIKYAGQEVVTRKVSKATLVNNRYVDVIIRLNAGGTLDVIHAGTNYHSKVSLPGFAPISGGRILFGARTGGEREIHLIDDLAILLNADVPDLPKPATAPTLSVARTATGLSVTFTGTLQSADSATGPWTDVAAKASPLALTPSGGQKFYRAKQ